MQNFRKRLCARDTKFKCSCRIPPIFAILRSPCAAIRFIRMSRSRLFSWDFSECVPIHVHPSAGRKLERVHLHFAFGRLAKRSSGRGPLEQPKYGLSLTSFLPCRVGVERGKAWAELVDQAMGQSKLECGISQHFPLHKRCPKSTV